MPLTLRAAACGCLLACASLACGCSAADRAPVASPSPPSRQRVRTAPVTVEAIAPPLRASGFLVARDQATLSFKVGGVVARIRVRPGDAVRPGQRLAELDTREIDAQLRQAELALQKATRDHERAVQLYAKQAVAKQTLDDSDSAVRLAEQALDIARFNRTHAVIVAPSGGRVARRLAEPGSVVAGGAPVLALDVAASGYVVRAGLVDRDFVRVALGDKALVTFDAFAGRRFAGTIVELAAEPSPLTGIYDVLVRLDAPPPRAVAGLVAKLEIPIAAPPPIALVPIEALVEGDGRAATVFVLGDDGCAHRRRVESAFLIDRRVAVSAGLVRDERVITEGAAFVSDGAPVQVAP